MHKSGHGDVKVANKIQLHETLNKIIKHNNDPSKSSLYKIGLNQFSHLTEKPIEEKMSLKKTIKSVGDNESKSQKFKRSLNSDQNLHFENTTYNCHKKINWTILNKSKFSKNLDWSDKTKNPLNAVLVTPIKDQGYCGSCYAFAAASVIEGQVCADNIKNCQNWTGISEQYILDCGKSAQISDRSDSDKQYDRGCEGGNSDDALNFCRENGVYEYNDYPYKLKNWDDNEKWAEIYGDYSALEKDFLTETVDYCDFHYKKKNLKKIDFNFSEICKATPLKDDEIRYILLTKGPVAASMFAGTDFSKYRTDFNQYSSGIYTPIHGECDCIDGECLPNNHVVTLVGYGYDENLDKNFWIVKNSWDETWGDNGYFKIEAGKNVCGIETEIFYIE